MMRPPVDIKHQWVEVSPTRWVLYGPGYLFRSSRPRCWKLATLTYEPYAKAWVVRMSWLFDCFLPDTIDEISDKLEELSTTGVCE
jgi:hypothetical protein